jgi:hypothetical protein
MCIFLCVDGSIKKVNGQNEGDEGMGEQVKKSILYFFCVASFFMRRSRFFAMNFLWT